MSDEIQAEITATNGIQYRISRTQAGHTTQAVVTQLGAALRGFWIDGQPYTETFDADELPPSSCGLALAPWPNRVRDGRWRATPGDPEQQLDITEPDRWTALHGLTVSVPFAGTVSADGSAVTLTTAIFPQHGWPHPLEYSVTYRLTDDGITIEHSARNLGVVPAPFAVGSHLFPRIAEVPSSELTLTVDAADHYVVDERLLPTGVEPIAAVQPDLSAGAELSTVALDDGYRGAAGKQEYVHTRVEVWGDAAFRWVQVYSLGEFAHAETGERSAIAVEPMTGPADALNSHEGLVWIEPGERWSAVHGIRVVAA